MPEFACLTSYRTHSGTNRVRTASVALDEDFRQTMNTVDCYPYRTAAAREECFRRLDELADSQWPIRSEERMVPTSFGDTFVRLSGPASAPLIVLLHGAGATSLMWAPNIQALSSQYRTAAVDQMGEFGKSLCTRPPQTMQDLCSWLDELILALDPDRPVTVAGMSYGGALAAQYAVRFPERLDKLILLGAAATVLRPPVEFWLRLFALAITRERGLRSFFSWVFPDMSRTNPQWIEDTLDLLKLNMRSIQRHKTQIPTVLSDAALANLRPPTLVLTGENEVVYSPKNAIRRLRRIAPQVTAEIIPRAGHDLTFSQSRMINERILQFLCLPCAAQSY